MAVLYNGTLSGKQALTSNTPQVTTYTSGSGVYIPVSPNSTLRVTLVGGGGGGGYNCGGSGSGTGICTFKLSNTASIAYSVGTGGACPGGTGAGGDGGASSFGTLIQPGGLGGYPSGTSGTRYGSTSVCNGPNGGSSLGNQGGSSLYGIGAPLRTTLPTGYGAAGYATSPTGVLGTAGTDGLIIIEDFGG